MSDERERPVFIGGPLDGRTIRERFPEDHILYGVLPSEVWVPTNPPPADPGPMHSYEFEGGVYIYRGETT